MKKILVVAVFGLFLVSPISWAQETAVGPWSGRILLGYLAISGNTESTAANLEADVNWDGERWHHTLSGRAIGRSEDKTTTAESYKATYDAKFDLTERNYLFGLLDYNKTRFTSYDQQTFEFVGAGRRFIMTERHLLEAELGAGASQSDLNQALLPPGEPDSVDESNWRAAGTYEWKIGESAAFLQKINVSSGSSNTFTESISELKSGITGNLSMVLSYTIRNNSDVLPGTEKKDTFAAVSLEYGFGG
jgi:putative salt-induced outer membrane protein